MNGLVNSPAMGTSSLVPIVGPLADDPQVVYEELMEEIRHNLATRPRDLQTRIGPSEVGEPCDRTLILKLLEIPEVDEGPNWRAWVGTCMHAGLDDIFATSFMQNVGTDPRFLIEHQITVGRIGDWDLVGKCDLFDIPTGCVWDWKSKSFKQLKNTRRQGMSRKYRDQFHCYGLGMENAGYTVKHVGGIFMPRDGELRDSFPLFEPYDRQVALDALERANRLYALGKLLGPELAMSQYPKCDDEFCRLCGNWQAPYSSSRTQPTTVEEAFAR